MTTVRQRSLCRRQWPIVVWSFSIITLSGARPVPCIKITKALSVSGGSAMAAGDTSVVTGFVQNFAADRDDYSIAMSKAIFGVGRHEQTGQRDRCRQAEGVKHVGRPPVEDRFLAHMEIGDGRKHQYVPR